MKFNLKFNVVLLLGGSCEMAIGLSVKLIEFGFYPVLTYRNENGLKKINSCLSEFKDKFETVFLSLDSKESFDNLNKKNISYFVDFAQGDYESLVASASDSNIEDFFTSNITNRSLLLKEMARSMLLQKFGRFVFISSTAALRPNPGQGFYSASKNAAESIYKSIGIELSHKGITTVILRPGYINSGRGNEFLNRVDNVPDKYVLSSDEIIDTILFLLSEGSKNINATEIVIDGGLTAVK